MWKVLKSFWRREKQETKVWSQAIQEFLSWKKCQYERERQKSFWGSKTKNIKKQKNYYVMRKIDYCVTQ